MKNFLTQNQRANIENISKVAYIKKVKVVHFQKKRLKIKMVYI